MTRERCAPDVGAQPRAASRQRVLVARLAADPVAPGHRRAHTPTRSVRTALAPTAAAKIE